MVDNIQSSNSHHKMSSQEAEASAKDELFPGAAWSKHDVHKCIGQWVNNIIHTLNHDDAQIRQANNQLKESEKGE